MCDPISIAALGASVGGTVINGQEANATAAAQANARNATTTAELGRQQAFGDQSRGLFNNSLDTFSNNSGPAGLTTSQAGSVNAFNANAPLPANVGTITSPNAPAAVGNAENAKLADTFKTIGDRNAAHGALQGYDQNVFNNNVGIQNAGRKIDTISDISKTSAAVNKTEQQAAYGNAYRPPSGIGDVLKTAGTLGSFAAGGGGMGSGGSTVIPSASFIDHGMSWG